MKYWAPIKEIYDYLGKYITKDMKVLELGPSIIPFPHATHFCGWLDSEKETLKNYEIIDFSKDKFPYKDKEFDFVYARHVLEDLYNPFHCMDEMSRIAKCGYIECPSPISEMHLDSENYVGEPPYRWRGYQHHHYFVWNDGKINFLHKFPFVEHIKLENQSVIIESLKNPFNWNTYYIWKDKIDYKHHQHPKDYHSPAHPEYVDLIIKAVNGTMAVNEKFKEEFLK